MKQMTCSHMGGLCDESISGTTAEEMAQNFANHITEKHSVLATVMNAMSEDQKKEWLEAFRPKFEAAPAA